MSGDDCLSNNSSFRARCFNSVINAYAECRQYPALAAIVYDDDLPPNPKLTPQVIEFLVDVEKASHDALDRHGLFSVWRHIVAGATVGMDVRAEISDRCGRLYVARRLAPFDYFRVIRKRKERRAAA